VNNLPATTTAQQLLDMFIDFAESDVEVYERHLARRQKEREKRPRRVTLRSLEEDADCVARSKAHLEWLKSFRFVENYAECPADHEEPEDL
jgi:hypothetical protein